MHEPFIYKLVPALVEQMGKAYPEIKEKQSHVQNVIKSEEESFLRTLDTGLELFSRIAAQRKSEGQLVIPGRDVFILYDTYGFPYDLTEIIANEQGFQLDRSGFDEAMTAQQDKSRRASKFSSTSVSLVFAVEDVPKTEPLHHNVEVAEAHILDHKLLDVEDGKAKAALILDRTPFYAESGGQVSDVGIIRSPNGFFEMIVTEMQNRDNRILHMGTIEGGDPSTGMSVIAAIDSPRRWDIMRNHTATHLAHAALRKVLGDHVKQSGSYVGPDYMRFDFSHHQPMTAEEIRQVEEIVNTDIIAGYPVVTDVMDIDSAKKSGAMALFGEKYGDTVRVVSVPGVSKELCGGTHVLNTGQIGSFVIVAETGIASGVRRIECITGRKATEYLLSLKQFRQQVSQAVNRPESEALEGVRQLKDANTTLQKEIKKTKAAMFSGSGQRVGDEIAIAGVTLLTNDFGDTDKETMTAWIDAVKEKNEPVVAVAVGVSDGKTNVIAAASARAVSEFKVDIGALAKEIFPQFGGRGGGKAGFAQGSIATSDTGQFFAAFTAALKQRLGV
jgi:alanyl-tRNA synthetase